MSEYSDLEKLLSELPEITLPQSLSAENLFARMDAEAQNPPEPAPKSKTLAFPRRWRPILTYAAAFAVLVLVYYSAGLDRQAKFDDPAGAPAPRMASPVAQQQEAAAEPQMAAALVPEADMAAPSADAPVPMMAAAPDPIAFYRELGTELQAVPATGGGALLEGSAAELPRTWEMAVKDDQDSDLLYQYQSDSLGSGTVTIQSGARFSNTNITALGSFEAGGNNIIDMIPKDKELFVLERLSAADVLYTGDALTQLGPVDGTAALPDCGAVLVTVYNVADPQNVTVARSLLQEGDYRSHAVEEGNLVVASGKKLSLPSEGLRLCDLAPMVGAGSDNTLTKALDSGNVKVYPQDGDGASLREEYLLLSAIGMGKAPPETETWAVLGSKLTFQRGGKTAFVLSEDAASGAKPLDSFTLGSLTVEMR